VLKKVNKIQAGDLSKVLGDATKKKKLRKKKKKVGSVLKSTSKIKKKKKKSTANLNVAEILKAKKGPSAVVKKTGIEADEEFQKWLATEPGFLEGLTSDVLGNPTKLYYYQIKYILDKAFFIHIDKSRQCLPEGSIINTPTGPACIEDLKSGDSVYSFNIEKQIIEIDEVNDAWESGIRTCKRIHTKSCNRVDAGENHPFLLKDDNWKKNKELKSGDELKYCKGLFGAIVPEKVRVLLLAYFMTDGSTVIQPKFTNNDKRMIDEFIKAVKIFDPSLSFRTLRKGNGFETFLHAGHGTCKKNKIHKILEKWNLRGKRKENKFLPEEVFTWNRSAQKLLLNRMYCCDGWYSVPKGTVSGVGFGSSNRLFIYQIQQLLWNFGIDSKVRQVNEEKKNGYRNFWKIEITYQGSISKFYNEIGISSKQHYPLSVNKRPIYEENRIYKNFENIGKRKCFDISVKKNENFIFEGLVVHNTGFSYVYACRSLARSHLSQHHTSIFISINQEEANEKIAYSRALYESLPNSIRKKCVVDNKHSLEFEASNGNLSSRTRIISYAQREPRGKGGNVDVYLDEAAHYTWGEQIYVAAVPIITRGTGTLTIGSSPLGKKGIHYDIIAKDAYKRIYSYHEIFWWQCIDFVKKGKFREANRTAVGLSTEQRVAAYGSEKIIGIFISMDLEQFQQEYELLHIDESVSFFPIDLINKCVYEILIDDIFSQEDDYSEKLTFPIVEKYPEIDFRFYENLDDLALAVNSGKVSFQNLYSGYDVGRKKNAGEFSIIEEVRVQGRQPLQIVRHLQTFQNKKFKYQKNYLKRALDMFGRLKMKIDSGGMGEDMSEELADYSWRVEPIHFTNDWKEEVCADFRIRLEESLMALPNRKDVKNQIHSIKRKVTESGRFIFDAEKNKNHHGDIYWSIAMASSFGERVMRSAIKIPNLGNITAAPKIVPISLARSFQKIAWPTARMPIGVGTLKVPQDILKLHKKIANG